MKVRIYYVVLLFFTPWKGYLCTIYMIQVPRLVLVRVIQSILCFVPCVRTCIPTRWIMLVKHRNIHRYHYDRTWLNCLHSWKLRDHKQFSLILVLVNFCWCFSIAILHSCMNATVDIDIGIMAPLENFTGGNKIAWGHARCLYLLRNQELLGY
jgi:hypothetical protein